MGTYTQVITFTVTDCGQCHVAFGITNEMEGRLRKNGQTFYCPNGHSLWYGKSEADKLKEKLASTKDDLKYYQERTEELHEEKSHLERRVAAKKGQLTKIKKRIANGICPLCHRSFQGLKEHMTAQHPEFNEEKP